MARKHPIGASGIMGWGRVLCLIGAGLGALGVLAWLLGMERVLTFPPSLPPMTPNSALAIFLLGASGALVIQRRSGRLARWLVLSAALAVLAISLGTVAGYALGGHLFLDQLFRNRIGPYYPTSSLSAVTFASLAAAIAFYDSGRRFRISEWLILGAAFIAITTLLGYLYGASSAYALTGPPGATRASIRAIRITGDLLLIGLSFPTALGLFLISTGLFLGRPDWITMRIIAGPNPGGMLMRRLVPIAVLVPMGFGLIAARLLPRTGDDPLVLAGLTDATGILSLALLGITARRINHGHDALEHARHQAREIFDLASDGIYIADTEGRLLDVNEAGCAMHGYSRGEMRTKSILDLIPPEDRERLQAVRMRMLDGHTEVGEWTGVRKDGSHFPVEVSAKIFPDGRWQSIVRDISERKRNEEALHLSEATARRATRARDEMLAVVAHDLRNPLTLVMTRAALLKKKGTERERAIGEEIERSADRMSRLIRDLVDFTRLEAGTLAIRQERLGTHQILAEVLDSQAPLAASASLALGLDAPSTLPDVWADHHRLMQVFENLVGNAIKFTPPDGRITLGAAAGTGEVLFRVADTGSGIRRDQLPHVFERFWQAPETKQEGVGLGLPIVKGIVEAHGGRVWVESSEGQGSTFFFTIPVAAQTAQTEPT